MRYTVAAKVHPCTAATLGHPVRQMYRLETGRLRECHGRMPLIGMPFFEAICIKKRVVLRIHFAKTTPEKARMDFFRTLLIKKL